MRQVVVLPNGIKNNQNEWSKEVEFEELTGVEEDILTDRTVAPGGKGKLLKSSFNRLSEILSRCTVKIGKDTRPEGKTRKTAPNYFKEVWDKAFMNDRGYAIVALRRLSLGDEYIFSETCPACSKEITNIKADLQDLEVRSQDLDIVRKEFHDCELPSGNVAQWRFLKGTDEEVLEQIYEKRTNDFLTYLINLRIVSINGEKVTSESIKELSLKDRRELTKVFDLVEGGMDTKLEITCNKCGHQFERKLNPGKLSFFFPSGI